ncbi:high frequency lysogenization protein HflD [Aliamphritea hakodatensis]|uniref:high frequency lysogenization protein HflD n=1 Tax=Aliamphritea hakodatensis TaxID=2895352 RepID=UPI0022FD8520|nr:high frequency lysogenization protein HflD [Aliamphritea hakodatensis]
MSQATHNQAIALAGLFQAASLVEQIATRGMVQQSNLETCIRSVFVTNPDSTAEIYGGERALPVSLGTGFRHLQELIDKDRSKQNQDVIRYALSLLHLEKKLNKQPELFNTIAERLLKIEQQAKYFNDQENLIDNAATLTHPTIIANLASLYQDTLSTFKFRIQVTGEPRHLQNAENADKIRALLLAGIRAAVLWRQSGGKRWQLLFFKSRIRPAITDITGR